MTKRSFAFGVGRTYIKLMRIFLIIVMVLSFGLTRAAFAMPVMTADMSMTDMTAVMNANQPMRHDMSSMHDTGSPEKSEPSHHTSSLSHGICALCFPAVASVLQQPRLLTGDRFAMPVSGARLLASAPEPLSPPPRPV